MSDKKSYRVSTYLVRCLVTLLLFYVTATARQSILEVWGAYVYAGLRFASLVLFLATVWHGRTHAEFIGSSAAFNIPTLKCGDPLLLLRFMACIFVLMQHGMGIAFQPTNMEKVIWDHGAWLLFPSSWLGVWIFFVLSGYLMGKVFYAGRYTFSSEGVLAFYGNRLLRIVPLYYIAVLVVALAVMPQIFKTENIGNLLSVLTFDNTASLTLNPIGALWSVAVEMQFYLGAPFLAAALFALLHNAQPRKLLQSFIVLLTFGLLFRCIMFVDNGSFWYSYVFTSILGNLDLFISGMLVALILQRFTLRSIPVSYAIVGLLMLYVAGAYVVAAVTTAKLDLWVFSFYGPTIGGITACAIIAIFESAAKQGQTINYISARIIRAAQLLGMLSYPIYVCHEPIYLFIRRALQGRDLSMGDSLMLVVLSLLIVFGTSATVQYLLERPLARFKYLR